MANKREGDFILNNYDKESGIPFNSRVISEFPDGTLITDSDVDNKVLLKNSSRNGGGYSIRSFDVGQSKTLVVDTMARMRNLTKSEILMLKMGVYEFVELQGYYEKGDTPAPIKYSLPISDTGLVDNGGDVIIVGDLYLVHDFNGVKDVSYYGLKRDGTDIRVRLNEIIASMSAGETLTSRKHTYTMSVDSLGGGIQIRSDIVIDFSGSEILAIGGTVSSYSMITLSNVINVTIRGIVLIGERDSHTGTTGEHGMGFYISQSENVNIEDCEAHKCWGDGFYVGGGTASCKNINIIRPKGDNNRRQGLSITNVNGMVVDAPVFTNTIGAAPQAGIDIEPNVGQGVQNLTIINPTCTGNAGSGIEAYNPSSGNAVINNINIMGTVNVSGNNKGINMSGSHPKTIDNLSIGDIYASDNGINLSLTGVRNGSIGNVYLNNSTTEVNTLLKNSYNTKISSLNIKDLEVGHKGLVLESILQDIFIDKLDIDTDLQNIYSIGGNAFSNLNFNNGTYKSSKSTNITVNNITGGGISRSTFKKSFGASVELNNCNSLNITHNNVLDSQTGSIGSTIFRLLGTSSGNSIIDNTFDIVLGTATYSIGTATGATGNFILNNTGKSGLTVLEGTSNTNIIFNDKIKRYGPTSDRPLNAPSGFIYYDTTISKPVVRYVTLWVEISPNASTTTKGLVNQTPAIPNITTPAVTTIEEANTQIQALSTKLNALLTAMRAAGMITP